MRAVLILALTAVFTAGPRSAALDGARELPLTVFVFAAPSGEEAKGRDLVKAAEMVGKRIAARKSWFRVVADRSEARVVVEVESHSVRERLTIWASTGTMRGELEGATRYSITKEHFLEATATVDGAELSLKSSDTSKRGSLKGAASGLALELEKQCEKRYGKNPR